MSIRTRDMTAGRLDRVRLGMSRAVLVALGTSLLISAVMLLFGRAILRLFFRFPGRGRGHPDRGLWLFIRDEYIPGSALSAASPPLGPSGAGQRGFTHALRRDGVYNAHLHGLYPPGFYRRARRFSGGGFRLVRGHSRAHSQLFRYSKTPLLKIKSAPGHPVGGKSTIQTSTSSYSLEPKPNSAAASIVWMPCLLSSRSRKCSRPGSSAA